MKTAPAVLSVLALALNLIPARAQSVALNDEFATREILPSTVPVHWEGSGAELTIDIIDGLSVCAGDLDDCELEGTMWFEWTAPEAGVYSFVGESPYGIAVFSAPPPPAPQVPSYSLKKAHGVAYFPNLVEAVAGDRFWIMVFDEGDPQPGHRTSLDITKVSLAGATKETATVLSGTSAVQISQAIRGEGWWRWSAPAAGRWRVVSSYTYANFEGAFRADGTPAPAFPGWAFNVAAGEEIFFHAAGQPGWLSWVEQTMVPVVLPSNLTAASAQPLTPDADGNGARYFFEGVDDQETGNLEAWFSWVAPRNGVAGLMPANSDHVKAYRDDNGTLTRVDEPVGMYRQPWLTVTAGQRYLIAVPAWSSTEIRVEYLLHRGSDAFAGAPELDLQWQRDYFGDAASEPGEPGATVPADRTRWWTITPATGGILYLSGYKAKLYTGNSLNSLTPVTAVDYNGPGYPHASPVVAVQAGTVYRLQVFEDPRFFGLTTFYVEIRPNTPNDHFANALPAVMGSLPDPGINRLNLTGATAEAGEPQATPGVPAVRTAWLRWTAAASGRILLEHYAYFAVDPGANTAPPVVAVWKGTSLTNLERVPLLPFQQAYFAVTQPSFDVVAGSTCYIQVEAVSPDSAGIDVKLTPVFADVSASDAFAAALPAERVKTGGGVHYRVTQRATFEAGESLAGIPPAPAGQTAGSYWIRWTAPSAGVWRFSNRGLWFRPYTVYGASLAGGRLGLISSPESASVYVKLAAGEVVHLGFIEYQMTADAEWTFYPALPDITPAVPGIALAKWYGLPSPVNLNTAYSSDGIPLLLKHALGLDPLRNSLPGGNDPNASRWPLLTLNLAGEPSLSFRAAAPFQTGAGVDLAGEISPDLRTWQPAPETSAGGIRTVSLPMEDPRGFLRLRALLR